MTDDVPLEIVRASPARWSDVEELLGAIGEDGTWCQAWRGSDAKAISDGRSRPELLRDQMRGKPPAPGYLVYLGAVPVGWVVSVRSETPRLMHSRTFRPSTTCPSGRSAAPRSGPATAAAASRRRC